tara:strand:+ start:70 stop:267 length:198 start_codon:yes stop_codon:yes gene_type:complete
MCIICIEIEKNRILPWEASRNLLEMSESLDPEHVLEVLDLISKIENENQICEVCEEQFSACDCQE